jgi:cellulose synthase/poly-beta-1,6-N-acetylglucosamine synthase-like glycosyltransferase
MSVIVLTLMFVVLSFTALTQLSQLSWALLAGHGRARSSTEVLVTSRAMGEVDGVSMIIAAHNEAVVIVEAVENALVHDYPHLQVLVVSDGSTDDTVARLRQRFDLRPARLASMGSLPSGEILATWRAPDDPRLVVLELRGGGGKAGAVNAGINHAIHPWVAVRDADEVLAPDVISRCMDAVVGHADRVVAVGTTLLPSNGLVVRDGTVCASPVAFNPWVGFQTVEYLAAFMLARPALSSLGALPFVSGGFGLFSRDALVAVGGFVPGHLGEDLDVSLRLHRWHRERGLPYSMVQVPEAIVYTEFPSQRAVLRRQRVRWHRGLREAVKDHRVMLHRRYRRSGLVGFGSLYTMEWLGAFVEGFGWLALAAFAAAGVIEVPTAAAMVLAVTGLSSAMVAVAIVRAVVLAPHFRSLRSIALLATWTALSGFGYRQLTLWWRLRALMGSGHDWGVMTRRGFGAAPARVAA